MGGIEFKKGMTSPLCRSEPGMGISICSATNNNIGINKIK